MGARKVPTGWLEAVLDAKRADMARPLREVVVSLYGEEAWERHRCSFDVYVCRNIKFEPGFRVGKLTLLVPNKRKSVWKCDCGRERMGSPQIIAGATSKYMMCEVCTKSEKLAERLAARRAAKHDAAKKRSDLVGTKIGMLSVLGTAADKYVCRCDCGNMVQRTRKSLLNNPSANKNCGCVTTLRGLAAAIRVGDVVGRWAVIGGESRFWIVKASCCGDVRKLRGRTQMLATRCACSRRSKKRRALDESGRCVPAWYWRNVGSRGTRHMVKLTYEQANRTWEESGGVCALSGLPISFSDRTASLDRINSKMGYEPGNVQWVHKYVNKMKLDHSEATFVELCRAVVRHYDSKQAKRSRRQPAMPELPFV